ncbi:class I SAM-dependent methyltransferase [Actinoplanes sichuanensis]|uniref:Class I SAM-dependent methyltransferase n=1 Tax=Actinoplanes sichuanensis TaxID=512349 RepID=A0ABW4APC6_9ACTN|nr:class I SAM-dependent methyltransferase [Actinoplanes sichuanensis]BEL05892.1 class I SAM-dependent methyltransferase [Actinoplanes sichuanensis]
MTEAVRPETFWEQHYRTRHDGDAARPNRILTEVAATLPCGDALDLGCGLGGDTLWLARHGWQVTAVDIAGIAVERLRALARRSDLQDRVTVEQHDLARTFPTGHFDLISAHYLHTPFALDRTRVLRTAAHALRPGGHLLIVDHGSTAPWSWNQDPGAHHPTPAQIAARLCLDPGRWSVVRADMPQRRATGPGGQTATVVDNVLLIQRHEGTPDAA